MRLYGRKAIMRYLGLSNRSEDSWQRMRRRFASVILRDAQTGRIVAESRDIDAIRFTDAQPILRRQAEKMRRNREMIGVNG